MKVAFGLKAHSGWAALVVLGTEDGRPHVVDRARLELVEPAEASWAKAPYHAAERRGRGDARSLVGRAVVSARRLAVRELRRAVQSAQDSGHHVTACAVLTVEPMPGWSVEEILAVHFRMHKAEGMLFREALMRAAEREGLACLAIPEKALNERAERALGRTARALMTTIATLGKSIGPPWGKDQKDAALAALVALRGGG